MVKLPYAREKPHRHGVTGDVDIGVVVFVFQLLQTLGETHCKSGVPVPHQDPVSHEISMTHIADTRN